MGRFAPDEIQVGGLQPRFSRAQRRRLAKARRRVPVLALAGTTALATPMLVALVQGGTIDAASATPPPTTYTVNTTQTTGSYATGVGGCKTTVGSCSLPQAINAYNGDTSGSDVITFSVHGTFGLGAKLQIDNPNSVPLSVGGLGPSATMLNGANTGGGIIGVTGSGPVTLSGMTLDDSTGGGYQGAGGAIVSDGSLTLNNMVIKNNSATEGGAIFSAGGLTINQSTIKGNTATADGVGNPGEGGAIDNIGTLTVNQSMIQGNTATDGGGIWNELTLTIDGSSVRGNSATEGGGIYNDGTAILQDSATVTGNNASDDGGGIWNDSTVVLDNSSVSGNTAGNDGGGIWNSGSETNGGSGTVVTNSSTVSKNVPDQVS